jgi:asparaginyl-tRNA synthetase
MNSIKSILFDYEKLLDFPIITGGWIRSGRKGDGGNITFIDLVDGSCHSGIQLIISKNLIDDDIYKGITLTGSSLKVKGLLVKPPTSSKQLCEVNVTEILYFGKCDPDYPLIKNKMSLEHLREHISLRSRTNIFGVINRIRNSLSFVTHQFFQDRDFQYINTPIITNRDSEGAGEMFKVTTNDNKPFFQNYNSYLTVSGQLDLENFACALSKVYCFGPTFRSEKSLTTRHLAEFWMIEAEICFIDLEELMNFAEAYIKFSCNYVLKNNLEDMQFLEKRIDKDSINRLTQIITNDFKRLSYTDAVNLLIESKEPFENKLEWGCDLNSEHERYLCEKIFNKPVIIYNFPKGVKAFYMKLNDDNRTVQAMDILVPGIGELIGGSVREEDYSKLKNRMTELNMDLDAYKNYLDLRRYGTINHGGWGCGFERLVMLITGMTNIKDVIPMPRIYGRIY